MILIKTGMYYRNFNSTKKPTKTIKNEEVKDSNISNKTSDGTETTYKFSPG